MTGKQRADYQGMDNFGLENERLNSKPSNYEIAPTPRPILLLLRAFTALHYEN